MFIFSSISSGLKLRSVNHTSIFENFESIINKYAILILIKEIKKSYLYFSAEVFRNIITKYEIIFRRASAKTYK